VNRRRCPLPVAALLGLSLLAVAATAQPTGDVREGRGENELVLIHGLGANAGIWDEVIPFLENSFRVETYELHGHGSTPPLENPTIESEAAALGEWLKAKDLPLPTLVGHGLGGMIAMQFAFDHPADVHRVIVIDAGPKQMATAAQKEAVARELQEDYDRFVASRYLAASEDPDVADTVVDMALRTDSTSLASLLMSSFDWDLSDRIASFSVPMLVVASENFLPESGYEREWLATYGYDGARTLHFKKMPATGHFVMLEQPARLASIIAVYARQDDFR